MRRMWFLHLLHSFVIILVYIDESIFCIRVIRRFRVVIFDRSGNDQCLAAQINHRPSSGSYLPTRLLYYALEEIKLTVGKRGNSKLICWKYYWLRGRFISKCDYGPDRYPRGLERWATIYLEYIIFWN